MRDNQDALLFDDGGDDGHQQIDIQEYLRTVRKHKWPIVLFTAAVTAMASYYAYTATPIYRARAVLLVEEQKANLVSIEELYGVDSNKADYYQTQFELLKSRGLAKKVIDHLGLATNPLFMSPEENGAGMTAGAQSGSQAVSGESGQAGGTTEQTGVDGLIGWFASTWAALTGGDTDAPVVNAGSPVAVGSGDTTAGSGGLVMSGNTDGVTIIEIPSPGAADSGAAVGNGASAPSTGGTNYYSSAMGAAVSMDAPPTDKRESRLISRFLGNLSIVPVRNTKLVEIHYMSPDPQLAADISNAVGEQYILSYLDSKMEMTQKASAWLAGRVAALKQTLDESERRLQQFKEANGLIDVNGSVGRLNEQELLLATAELANAKTALAEASNLYRDVQSMRASAPQLLDTIPAVQNDALVRNVKIEQGQRQRELDELLNRYGDKHPKVIDARSRLASLNATLQTHIDRVVGTIEKDYRLLEQRVASIQRTLEAGKEEIQSIGSKKFELEALEREVTTNRELYNTYFNRLTETRSADGLETANATITEPAEAPLGPVKPNKQLIIALAALGSLILSMIMAFLYEQMDDTIKSTKDIEEKLGIKLIGILPMIKAGLLRGKQDLPVNPLTIKDKKGTFVEAVNTARTVLSIDRPPAHQKVILVTSSVPGEGKSTSALNLAYSMSQMERVLLIDCDLRRPSIAKSIGTIDASPGLSDLITHTAAAKDCIRRRALGELDVLPSGRLTEQPLELLSSTRMVNIVEKLSQYYDKIVLDCAPTQAVSDALVLSRLSDSVLYCVKSHDTSFEVVKRGLQRLRQIHAPLAGVLMTQVDIDKLSTYGGDHYYQGYYDYYGYSDKEIARKHGQNGKLSFTQQELQAIRTDERVDDLEFGAVLNGRAARHMDDHYAQESEFDMTTRIADNDLKRLRGSGGGNQRRLQDDLDIL